MVKSMPGLLPALLIFITTLLVGCGDEGAKLNKGEPPPAFTLEQLKGGSVAFPDDLKGKIVVVRFWADWCPFCESEMRAIEPVYQKYQGRGLVILAINVRQDRKRASAFIDKLNISYDVLLDPEGSTARSYGVLGLPTTFILDRKGNLHTQILGESTPDVFAKVIEGLL